MRLGNKPLEPAAPLLLTVVSCSRAAWCLLLDGEGGRAVLTEAGRARRGTAFPGLFFVREPVSSVERNGRAGMGAFDA